MYFSSLNVRDNLKVDVVFCKVYSRGIGLLRTKNRLILIKTFNTLLLILIYYVLLFIYYKDFQF